MSEVKQLGSKYKNQVFSYSRTEVHPKHPRTGNIVPIYRSLGRLRFKPSRCLVPEPGIRLVTSDCSCCLLLLSSAVRSLYERTGHSLTVQEISLVILI